MIDESESSRVGNHKMMSVGIKSIGEELKKTANKLDNNIFQVARECQDFDPVRVSFMSGNQSPLPLCGPTSFLHRYW